jgi:DNA-binding SARP family transcriptional activator/tetratricopeptide (TPR) repeat protein
MMDRTAVQVRLIGPMEARTANGRNVLPSGRKTRALLAHIALATPRPVLRSRLIEQLWSRSPREQARASLRQEIHRLMNALSPAEANILVVTRSHLALQPGTVSIDVHEVTQANSERPAALSLLEADLLEDLEGVDPNFDAWLQVERNRLRNRGLRIAESMLQEVITPGETIEAAERVLTIDRTHEGAWRALMNVHHARGERGLAIQAYTRCRAALADTADAMPSATTQKLLDEIRGRADGSKPLQPTQSANVVASPAATVEHHQETQNAALNYEGALTTTRGTHIGVMPFRVIGSPDDHACVAALGLADEITNALSRFRWISVVPSESLDRFAADKRAEAAIKRELGLNFLLDGSVQRAGNKIRISVQLLDLRAKNQIVWVRRFDRENYDLLSLQEEIAAGVAAQIDPEILLIEAERSMSRGPVDATADDLMLRAIPLIGRMEQEQFMRAGKYLADAIALEPDYPRLYAWYAHWHMLLVGQDWAADPTATMEKAGEMAARAVLLDPFDARGLAVNGHVLAFLHRRLPEAMALHDRALLLNPNLAMAWALSGIAHAYAGNLEQAERRYNRYKTLSPLDPHAFFFDASLVLINLMKRDYEAAVEAGQAVVQLNPSFSAAYKPYLAALGHLRRDQEAAGIRQRLLMLEPLFTIERFLENNPIERERDRMHYAEGLRLAGIPADVSVCS